jgi:hypothetical protein
MPAVLGLIGAVIDALTSVVLAKTPKMLGVDARNVETSLTPVLSPVRRSTLRAC